MALVPSTSVGGAGGVTEYDFAQITAAVTVTATVDGNGNGTAVITGAAVSYDGVTRIKIEFTAAYMQYDIAGQNVIANLYDGTTDLGRIASFVPTTSASGAAPGYGCRFLTPSAGSHTYIIRAWKTNAGGTAVIQAGAGGASTTMPATLRVTSA